MALSQNQLAGLAQQVGLVGQAVQIASAVAMAESGGNPNAVNPGHPGDPEYSVGLWQINIRAHPQYTEAQMKDPVQNAKAMYAISSGGSNWNPWGTYTNGLYKQYMTSGVTPDLSYATNNTSNNTRSNVTTNPAVLTDLGSGFKYILAYTIAIAFFIFIAKFKAGYASIYYALLICVLMLFVLEAPWIADALKPLTQPNRGETQTALYGTSTGQPLKTATL